MRDEDWERERDLDRNFEREGAYTDRRPPALNERGTVRTWHERRQSAGVIQPPVKIGGAR